MSASTKTAPAPKYWCGQPDDDCDVCSKPIADMFIDGRTVHGSWANMCPGCHRREGIGLGTGKGQRYERQLDGRWLKTS